MKIYISVDIEGITGLVHFHQYSAESGQQYDMRLQMTREANAAVAGAFEGGATEVLVNDAHGTQKNLIPFELDKRARLILGNTKPLSMMQGIDESFDGAFFVGYHGGAGMQAVCSHTYTDYVSEVRLNGQPAGEVMINAAVAGYFGVPVALVTGDSAVCNEALSILGAVETVAVKEPITRASAKSLHPEIACERIKAAAKSAVERLSELEPFTLEPPIRLAISFTHAGCADRAEIMPGSRRLDAVTVGYESEDFHNLYRGFLTMLDLAGTAA
ncbi:MAG: M55 family metallopeptidase [Armatimonadetes bacterium]|nr:M55 family metallopeptidase [Armatimonadota bacterium]